jgi:uncharacterized protein (DUF302 family)
MMMRQLLVGMFALLLAVGSWAQQPGAPAQPSPEQIQRLQQLMMVRQMQMMSLLFKEQDSRLGVDATVSAIKAAAAKRGWRVGEVRDMQALMRQHGDANAKPMKVVFLCPADAEEKLSKAGSGKTPPLPCRATVFADKDGKVHVIRTNYANMAKTIQGDVGKALSEIGAEEDALYKDILM